MKIICSIEFPHVTVPEHGGNSDLFWTHNGYVAFKWIGFI